MSISGSIDLFVFCFSPRETVVLPSGREAAYGSYSGLKCTVGHQEHNAKGLILILSGSKNWKMKASLNALHWRF